MKRMYGVLLCSWCAALSAQAQYYYKDIVLNRQLVAEMADLKAQKIRTVKVRSFDREDEPSEGFFCEKRISRDYTSIETKTRSYATPASLLTATFNKKGQIIQSVDSTAISTGIVDYVYDDKDNLVEIRSGARSADEDFTSAAAEKHLYQYNANGQPEKLIRVKNNGDSIFFRFVLDEKGNVAEEQELKSGKTYYYYYDAKNRLTDVVYYNASLRKLLPIVMYEYNSLGQVVQMMTAEEGTVFYYTWRYQYENGLKIREKCFYNKKSDPQIRDPYSPGQSRNLQGIIEYEYQ
jgi:hypothetical protein